MQVLALGDSSRYVESVVENWTRRECNMDLPPSFELDLIRDPETGLALLAKCAGGKTPEQERERLFWQLQFMAMRDWRAGDTLAVSRALTDCSLFNRPPPFWLLKTGSELCVLGMSAAEKRARRAINKHFLCWKAVKLVRGRHPKDPRNYKKKVRDNDAVYEEAAKMLAVTGIKLRAGTVKKSYTLINRAGGAQVTLPSYKREVKREMEKRKRRRERLREKNKSG
jgi:hypothetical protein